MLVNAGPGTGKTATLVRRITYLIGDCQAEPEQVLVLTFSNDAADELRQRIASRLGDDIAARLEVSTFHGFGVKFLHHHGQFLGLDANALILDETGQEDLVLALLGTTPCGDIVALHRPEETVKQIVRHIGYLKDRLYTPDDFIEALDAWGASEDNPPGYAAAVSFAAMFRAYEAAKQEQQRVDFADLIALPQRLLAAHDTLREAYRAKYHLGHGGRVPGCQPLGGRTAAPVVRAAESALGGGRHPASHLPLSRRRAGKRRLVRARFPRGAVLPSRYQLPLQRGDFKRRQPACRAHGG